MADDADNKLSRSDGAQAPPPARARPALAAYKRDLPHLQAPRKTLFITFNTARRWTLPGSVRSLVIKHALHDHGSKYLLHAIVVMPDHVHAILTPLEDHDGETFGLAEIMQGIKSSSAHSINRALRRKGVVWQPESFDRILRSDEKLRSVADYICANPVRAGIVDDEDTYPHLWREWIEGAATRT